MSITTTVKGVDVERLSATIQAVATDPSLAKFQFRVAPIGSTAATAAPPSTGSTAWARKTPPAARRSCWRQTSRRSCSASHPPRLPADPSHHHRQGRPR